MLGGRARLPVAALAEPQVRGLSGWQRVPVYRIQQTVDDYPASISEVRIARRAGSGLGAEIVGLDHDLCVISC